MAAIAVVVTLVRPWLTTADTDDTLTHTVDRTHLTITVTERGNLESQVTVDGICELNGYQNKIIFIVEEGKFVEEGTVVVRFDSAEIDKQIAQQEILVNKAKAAVETTRQEVEVQQNTGESGIAEAQLELTLAKLDLEKYEQGDYKVKMNDLSGKIALAEAELEQRLDELKNLRVLVKKGFREPEQVRGAEQRVASAKYALQRDVQTLGVLEDYEFKRQITEFRAKAEEAQRKLVRSKATAEANLLKANSEHEAAKAELVMQEQQLKEWKDQKGKCEIVAKQSGILAYANKDWYDSDRRIREGAVVYRRQKIFSLPDMSLMQVKVNVHESVVKKVKEKQTAAVRVDAFPNQQLTGTVKSVSQLADSSNSWRRGGVKEYTTIVTLDKSPEIEIKPGMTAEVEILVDNLRDVVAVPVQAVTEHKHHHFVYARTEDGFERQVVEIGQSNNRMVEITSGIDAGVAVALDARGRGIADFEDEELEFDVETEDEPTEEKATEEKATEEKATEDKATEDKATEDKATEDKATEDKATEDKATEDKATEVPPREESKPNPSSSEAETTAGDAVKPANDATESTEREEADASAADEPTDTSTPDVADESIEQASDATAAEPTPETSSASDSTAGEAASKASP